MNAGSDGYVVGFERDGEDIQIFVQVIAALSTQPVSVGITDINW